MAELRIGRGWSAAELRARLEGLAHVRSSAPKGRPNGPHWRSEHTESVIGHEEPGPPLAGGAFARAREALARYELSDPSIVVAHALAGKLCGRRMLLEIKVLGLRYLCGVVVSAVIDETHLEEGRTLFGFRYETLEGHIERGAEWFLIEKDHASGEIRFCIRSRWHAGDFPNRWSRAGFTVLSPYYRRVWLRRAHERLRALLRERPAEAPEAAGDALLAAAGLGALSGARSLSAPTLLAWQSLDVSPRAGEGVLERALDAPSAVLWLTAAALGEVAADKHPRMQPRVAPVPLAGRVAVGALAGAVIGHQWRAPVAGAAAVGAGAAGLSAVVSYQLRTRLARRTGAPSAVVGLLEDGLVLAGAWALSSRLGRGGGRPEADQKSATRSTHAG